MTPETMTSPATGNLCRYRVENGVAILELCDPPANTYTYEMMRELDDAILKARFDESVHVILMRGAGEKFFCAGANIKMLQSVNPYFKYYFCLHANETLNRLEQTPKLVIASLNGHCVGGGLEIAMAADIRIAKRNAGKIGLPEVSLGVLPGTGGTQRLARLVGKPRSIEMMTTGATYSFEEAEKWDLVIFAAQILEGRGTHQAGGAVGSRGLLQRVAGHRTGAAAAALPERRREGRPDRVRREAPGQVHRQVIGTRA